MRVKLEDVCERGSSNIKQSDIIKMSGNYPIYGASGLAGKVNFYHQEQPYVAVVKDGAGIGRTTLNPAKSSVMNFQFTRKEMNRDECITRIFVLCCELYAFRKILHWSNHSTYLF